ncbi:MAG: LPXTG cell wall anchor domain-containing protein [Catenulispora sp.]
MALRDSRTLPSLAIVGAALLLPGGVAQAAAAAPADAATSTLISVTMDRVPALGLRAFHGTFATSAVAQNNGDDAADTTQDPARVLRRITINSSAQSRTSSDPAKTWARAQLSAAYSLHGKQIYSVDALDSYADCTSEYVHEDGVQVLGTAIPAGKTTAVPVTGSQIGVRDVDHGTLNVTYTTIAASGHAHLDLVITGSFYSSAGRELYSGPMQKVRFGDVQVACASSTPATPAAPTVTVTVNDPADPTDAADPAAPKNPQPVSSGDAPEPARRASTPLPHSHHTSPPQGASSDPAASGNGAMRPAAQSAALPRSSDISVWWMVLSGLGLAGGILLYFATRRRGGHQQ